MNTAEKLRNEMVINVPFTKDEFISKISERIKRSGLASFVCDHHIRETDLGSRSTIRMAHEFAALKYAESEGFRFRYKWNSYGVRYLIFTL